VVLSVAPHLKMALDLASEHVKTVVRNFTPALISRGVIQVSAYIDALIASLLPTGAVAAVTSAQILYTLPVSLFGISVSAAELPAMAASAPEKIPERLNSGLRRIAFFVVPSAVAFMALGDVVTATLLVTGRFSYEDAVYVWAILAGAGIGLLPSTLGRLYSSTFYALRDTRTPLRYALVHVGVATVLGYLFAIPLPVAIGIAPAWGAAGLTIAAGIGAWIEMLMLRRALNLRIGRTGLPFDFTAKLWAAAIAAAAVAWLVKNALPAIHPVIAGALILGPYGVVFFGATFLMRIPEASAAMSQIRRRI